MFDRRSLTPVQKLHVLCRYSRCPECGEKFGALDEIDWDHIGQLSLTGDNSLENFRPIHRADCHKRKTARDAADRAKAVRCAEKLSTAAIEETRRAILAKGQREPEPSKWPKRKMRNAR